VGTTDFMARIPVDDERFSAAREVGENQGWVLSRKQLYAIGITRWEIRGQVRMRRWQLIGDQSVCLHNGPIEDWGHHWAAVFQGGPRARLDGASALVAGGLKHFTADRIRVSVPRGARIRRNRRYNIRQTRRWDEADTVPSGIPRTRPAVAAVRGFLWASTDKEASYLLTATVQQGLASAEAVGHEALRILRDKRRGLLYAVVDDLLGGARSLGELDVVRELRRRGLPPPQQQALRRDKRGRYYLDLYWERWHLVVEVEGIHHTWASKVIGDALRQNFLAIAGDTVLRVPLLGLRLEPDAFYGQIEEALRRNGWPAAA
jgi:very-short-patch-repair endonuclease